MKLDFEQAIKSGVDQAMKECELTIGMTLKEAVEKQIPKKPGIPFDSISQEYECPKCPHTVYKTQLYCDKCGQALDWGDGE